MEWIYAKGIPIEAQYLYRKGLELENAGKAEAALAYLKQSVILAPQYGKAIFEMGNCLALMGRHNEAMQYYTRAVKANSPAGVSPASVKT